MSKNPKWIRTLCPVPAFLAQALGYNAGANLIGIYWDSKSRKIVLNDGVNVFNGNSYSFVKFYRHSLINSYLSQLKFGFQEQETNNWLVLDRHAQTLYCVNKEVALPALLAQGDDLFGSMMESEDLSLDEVHFLLDMELYRLENSVQDFSEPQPIYGAGYFVKLTEWLENLEG